MIDSLIFGLCILQLNLDSNTASIAMHARSNYKQPSHPFSAEHILAATIGVSFRTSKIVF